MSKNDREIDFIHKIGSALDESAQQLDGATLSRLRQARAVATAGTERRRLSTWKWLSAGGVALASVAILSAVLYVHMARSPGSVGVGEELELALSADSPDLYENLEFYQWLAEENRDAG